MLFEPSDTIGQLIAGVNSLTGSTFLTLILLTVVAMLIFMAVATPFGIPLEFSIILILPLHIGMLAYISNWMAVAGAFIFYLGFLIARNILSR